MSHTFEQFVRFTTDAAGLERTFRLFQSTAQILSSYTLPFECLLAALAILAPGSAGAADARATTHAALVALRGQLALARRYFRLFRFLESFLAAQKLYASLSHGPLPPPPPTTSSSSSSSSSSSAPSTSSRFGNTAVWIDVFGRTFNGMYLLLEASTIADAQRIPGFAVWGPELEARIAVEGQRFWLFTLVCGVLAGLVRIADVLVPYAPAPVSVGHGDVDSKEGDGASEKGEDSVVGADGEDEKTGGEKGGKEAQVDQLAKRREIQSKISGLGRRVVSDALDITLPGSVVGWVPVSTGTVGLAMFVTTVLTSMDIWERCGREVASSRK
ncbi:hypothetical protein F5Y12DRAFT_555357 [Xylaria sp. FL1777]|nr:hypothetical protein F5Y12DRAFT_555357 [Xylaria sp. FL1777]